MDNVLRAKDLDELVGFLANVSTSMKSRAAKRPWRYQSVYEFVLKNGKPFLETDNRPVATGIPKNCFGNACNLATLDKRLYYVEGYACAFGLPVHHAWCVDRDMRIIEPTWPEYGKAYFGCIFPLDYVSKTILKTETHGVIDKWELDWPLVTGADDYEEILKRGFGFWGDSL